MTRDQLEHVIRAAATIANESRLVIVGSQAILAAVPDPPAELTQSMEADLYPLDAPEKAELIDGSIGEGSPFHETFGYYAHGVGPETASLPSDWMERAVTVHGPGTSGATAFCPSVEDLLLAKLAAGRDKDFAFVEAALRHGLANAETIAERATAYPEALADTLRARLTRVRPSDATNP